MPIKSKTPVTMPARRNFKWSMNEINRLYNEYELKQLTVQEIAFLHARTNYGILNKLCEEGLINLSWSDARGWTPNMSLEDCSSDASENIILDASLDATSDCTGTIDEMPYTLQRLEEMENKINRIWDFLASGTISSSKSSFKFF